MTVISGFFLFCRNRLPVDSLLRCRHTRSGSASETRQGRGGRRHLWRWHGRHRSASTGPQFPVCHKMYHKQNKLMSYAVLIYYVNQSVKRTSL